MGKVNTVSEIEQGDISVDELSVKVKRAAELIKICKSKLTSTEEDVNKIFEGVEFNNKRITSVGLRKLTVSEGKLIF